MKGIWKKVKKWSKQTPEYIREEEEVSTRQQDLGKKKQKQVWLKWKWKF